MAPDEPDLLRLIFTCCHPALNEDVLLALMLLHDSRRAARTKGGKLIVLDEQDRSLWDRAAIDEGLALLDRSIRLRVNRPVGTYQLRAAISALHARAESAEVTDWTEIADLYGALPRINDTPVVRLNRAVALAVAECPDTGLRLMQGLDANLAEFHLLHAARAELLRRAERRAEAGSAYEQAIALCANAVERRYLERRLAEVRCH
jgi:RNA polymerase sigma-70 factor (ECF subfamily)